MAWYKKLVCIGGLVALLTQGTWAEAEGVEQALQVWKDTDQGFTVQYPGGWTVDKESKAAAAFHGANGAMTVDIVVTEATPEVAGASLPPPPLASYQKAGWSASTEVRGAWVLSFKGRGLSSVTGKPVDLQGDRYVLPGRHSVVVITVWDATRLYDREGIRDIALSFAPGAGK